MEKPKVLALVMCFEIPPHDVMASTIKETWGEERSDDVDVIYYWANGKGGHTVEGGAGLLVGKDLILGVDGTRDAILKKTIMAYRWLVKNAQYDYVFRCCSGAYVRKRLLFDLACRKPKERVWAGYVFTGYSSTSPKTWIGGGGMLLSKDVVRLIVENEEKINSFGYPGDHDDVSVGQFLLESGVSPDSAPVVENAETATIVEGCHHYHFRGRPDLMREIHALLNPV